MLTFYECEYQPDFILNGGTCGGIDENVDMETTAIAHACYVKQCGIYERTGKRAALQKRGRERFLAAFSGA